MKNWIEAWREYRFYVSHFGGKHKVNIVYLSRQEQNIHGYKVFFSFSDDFLTKRLKTEIII